MYGVEKTDILCYYHVTIEVWSYPTRKVLAFPDESF
jgi:hypothetical protein